MTRPVAIRIPAAASRDEGGEVLLEGVLHAPASAARGSALVCHPHPAFGGHMDVPLVVGLAEALAGAGYRALRFNFRGVGGSRGTPTGGVSEGADVLAALAWLAEEDPAPAHAVGYSFGAALSLVAASEGARLASLTLIGLPTTLLETDARIDRLAAFVARDDRPAILCLAGEQDQFCEAGFLRARFSGPRIQIEILPGLGHFFDAAGVAILCERTLAFVAAV